MDCQFDHRWEWDQERKRWVCLDCGKAAESTDALIEPCLSCGAAADAEQAYCSECLGQ